MQMYLADCIFPDIEGQLAAYKSFCELWDSGEMAKADSFPGFATTCKSNTGDVYQFCRQSAHAGLVVPSHVRFVGASSQPFSEYKRRPEDRDGPN
jgi:hypothetical protein